MLDIGRICVKLTGKEAGNKAVIVDIVDKNFVLIESPWVNRRRCNIKHLEPLDKVLKIARGASNEDIEKALKEAEIEG